MLKMRKINNKTIATTIIPKYPLIRENLRLIK